MIAFVLQYRKKKLLFEADKKSLHEQHKAALLKTKLEIHEQTMKSIGEEIHDNVGQQLTLAAIYTQQIEHTNKYPELKERLDQISQLLNESIQDLRNISKDLTGAQTEKNIVAQLQNLCDKMNTLSSCKVSFHTNTETLILSSGTGQMLIRLVQEFFQNTLKHAAATILRLELTQSNDNLQIVAADNGIGFDTAISATGIGLQNMQHRATLLNATMQLESVIGKGTSIRLIIPHQLSQK